jgi:hypothetical protein
MQLRNMFRREAIPPPTLTVAQRVIDRIVHNALIYETETGESLVGFTVPVEGKAEPDLIIMDTIAPDESAIREGAYFEQGDDWQADSFNWLADNWKLCLKRQKDLTSAEIPLKYRVALSYLGDWHKHPGTLVHPSYGDSQSARDQIFSRNSHTPQLLVVLATVWPKWESSTTATVAPPTPPDAESLEELKALAEAAAIEPQTAAKLAEGSDDNDALPIKVPLGKATVRIDFWYMSHHNRQFIRLGATVVADKELPALPPLGWHLAMPDRMTHELNTLRDGGWSVNVQQHQPGEDSGLAVSMALGRANMPYLLVATTPDDYPDERPTLRYVKLSTLRENPPPEGAAEKPFQLFARIWRLAQLVPAALYPDEAWGSGSTIANLAEAVTLRLAELEKPQP